MNALPIGSRHREVLAVCCLLIAPAAFLLIGSQPQVPPNNTEQLIAVMEPIWHSGTGQKLEFRAEDLTFEGKLMEADLVNGGLSSDKVTTSFHKAPDGKLVGKYEIIGNEHFTGTLTQKGPIRDHQATFDWKDKFGDGTLDVAFDDDACEFTGSWRVNGAGDVSYSWQGHATSRK